MEQASLVEDKDSDVCFILDRNEVHYIIAAPPAYHASLDGFKDPTVQEAIDPKEMTILELKTQLMARGLPVSGKKAVLVKRLIDYRDNQLNFKGFFTELRKTKSAPAATSSETTSTLLPQQSEISSPSSSPMCSGEPQACSSPSRSNSVSSQFLSVKPVLRKETAIRPHELTVPQLRRHLSARGIPTHGKQKMALSTQLKEVLKEERKRALLQRAGSPISSSPSCTPPAAANPGSLLPPTTSSSAGSTTEGPQQALFSCT